MKRAAFIFLAPQTDPSVHRGTVKTPTMDLDAIAVPTYAEAARVAKDLVDQGLGIIELCGGFGIRGTYVYAESSGLAERLHQIQEILERRKHLA